MVDEPKSLFYLSIKVGIESPFHARILEFARGSEILKLETLVPSLAPGKFWLNDQRPTANFETLLASLADVKGLLNDVRPIAWVDEVRTDVNGLMTIVWR